MEPWLTTSAAVARRASSQAAARAAGMLAGSALSSAVRHRDSCVVERARADQLAAPGGQAERQRPVRAQPGRVPAAPLGQGQGAGHPPGRDGVAGEAQFHRGTGHHRHHVERFRSKGRGSATRSAPGVQHRPHDGVVLPPGGDVQRVDVLPAGDPRRGPVEHVPALGRARSRGGPGRAQARATPARRSPWHNGPSIACRSAVLAVPATARTTPWCCIHTKVVDRHAPARISMIWLAAANGRSRPPADRGPGHSVEALGGEQVQMLRRHPLAGFHPHRGRGEHPGGQLPGAVYPVRGSCPGHDASVPRLSLVVATVGREHGVA